MMKKLVILYAESEFTPWQENIDYLTVSHIQDLMAPYAEVDILHMEPLSMSFVEQLKIYDAVINLCYGFINLSQSDVAKWLDENGINHLSTPGIIQKQVQDKIWVENKAVQLGIAVPESLSHDQVLKFDSLYILKPRFGSCHKGIHILKGHEMMDLLRNKNFDNHILQHYIAGREFSVAVIPEANSFSYSSLHPVEIVPSDDRLIYVAGNSFGITQRSFQYHLVDETKNKLKNIAAQFHQVLGLRYMSRMDFRVTETDVYVLDVNAMPNLHPVKSLLPAMLIQDGLNLKDVILRWIEMNREYMCNIQPMTPMYV